MKFKFLSKNKINSLPKNPGVYAFKKGRNLLYIGKAANLKERVKNHFQSAFAKASAGQAAFRDSLFIHKVTRIGYIKTDSEIEALILEANLIKKYLPKYNVIWKDDKNYFFVIKTIEDFPRIFITHQVSNSEFRISNFEIVGPFVDGKALKRTLEVLRKVFPYRSCKTIPKRPCLWYQLGRCPAPCLLKSDLARQIPDLEIKIKKGCQQNTKNITKILKGKKIQVLKDLKREMKEASKTENFERAAKIRGQIGALEKILAHASIFKEEIELIQPWQNLFEDWERIGKELKKILKVKKKISKIEAYDVSNIHGQYAYGSMVTFINGKPAKNFYRLFKIRFSGKPNDIAMIKEILKRRFGHPEWRMPDLILIDGGIGQLSAALKIKNQISKIKNKIKIISLAKRKNNLYIEGQRNPISLKTLPRGIFNLILQARDEAHRFARKYHIKLREKIF